MKIVIEETAPGTWEIAVAPTRQDESSQPPTALDIVRVLHAVSGDLLKTVSEERAPKPQGSVIQMPSLGDINKLGR